MQQRHTYRSRRAQRSMLCAFAAVMVTLGSCRQVTQENPGPGAHLFGYIDDASAEVKVVSAPTEWSGKRAAIIRGMEAAMGPLPTREDVSPPAMQIVDSLATEAYTRYGVVLAVAESESVPAYLYVPLQRMSGQKTAAMLALHPTGDLGKKLTDGQGKPNRAYAKELAERGYVVIAPDYPSFGGLAAHDFNADRYQSGTMQAIFNHMRCIDLLQSLDYVDPERIGVIGHSLGGHNAMFVGVFDTRLKVIVSSCGWTLMDYYDIGEEGSKRYGGRLGPWAQDRYMPLLRDRYHLEADKIPFDFDEVIAALAPRSFLSVSPVNDSNFDVTGVRKGIESASEVYRLLHAEENLTVWYPDAAHDFPPDYRLKAYRFVDNVLNHSPLRDEIH